MIDHHYNCASALHRNRTAAPWRTRLRIQIASISHYGQQRLRDGRATRRRPPDWTCTATAKLRAAGSGRAEPSAFAVFISASGRLRRPTPRCADWHAQCFDNIYRPQSRQQQQQQQQLRDLDILPTVTAPSDIPDYHYLNLNYLLEISI